MKSYITEDQYRVVGTMDSGASRVAWYDSVEEAINVALTFDRATVMRPDGSLVGEYFSRGRKTRAEQTTRPVDLWHSFDLHLDAAAAGIAPAEMQRRAIEARAKYRVHISGVTHLEDYHRARLALLDAMVTKYASDARGLPQADVEGHAVDDAP